MPQYILKVYCHQYSVLAVYTGNRYALWLADTPALSRKEKEKKKDINLIRPWRHLFSSYPSMTDH